MERLNSFFFYEGGAIIRALGLKSESGTPLQDLTYDYFNASRWLSALLKVEALTLQVVRATTLKLKELVNEQNAEATKIIRQAIDKGTNETDPPTLDVMASYYVRDAISEFQTVLSAELSTADTYTVSKKGIYSTADLIERAENALSASLRAEISGQAVNDFRQAGKCLAFDLFTATGFHILRATDAVLRIYYERFVGTKPKPKMRNWGAYTKILTKCANDPNKTLRPDVKTIALIDQIREMHRNPIIHPEDNLDEDKALVLFDVCKSAITAMACELKETTPSLPLVLKALSGEVEAF